MWRNNWLLRLQSFDGDDGGGGGTPPAGNDVQKEFFDAFIKTLADQQEKSRKALTDGIEGIIEKIGKEKENENDDFEHVCY